MDLNPIVLSIPIYFLLIGIELLIQQFSRKRIYRINDAITNISCGITQQLSGIFFKVLSVGVYTYLFTELRLFTIPSTWFTIVVLFVIVDFCYYWAHRMSHEINLFWGGHVVHHQSEDYNLSVALRQGSFQIIWTFAFYLPLAILGFDPVDFVLISALNTLYQFWIHTETIGKLGILEYLFNTPSHHRVHHGRDPKYIDKNHAGVFIIWDKLFGTFQEEQEQPTYGITKPVNSWNPVWVNLDHYASMWESIKAISNWKDRLKFVFKKPGWFPENMGGYQPAREVEKKYKKYNTEIPASRHGYVLFQYVASLGITAFFLFRQQNLGLNDQLLFISAIVLSVVNMGGLLESKSWVWLSEALRIMFVSVILLYQLANLQLSWLLMLLILLYLFASLIWFVFITRRSYLSR